MKKQILFYLTLCIMLLSSAKGIGQSTLDTLYLWAKDGLELRDIPSTNGEKIDHISYGESIVVIVPTSEEYPLTFIEAAEESAFSRKIEAIVLEGVWIKIQSSQGKEGYIPGHYLSKFEPYNKAIQRGDQINLKPIKIDTLFKNTEMQYSDGLNWSVAYSHEKGIKSWRLEGGNWTTSIIEIPKANLEDALILLSGSWDDFSDAKVLMNWEGKTLLKTEDNCGMTLLKGRKKIEIIIECKEIDTE